MEGYNVNAIDFLHKPIFYPRFQQAMEKARRWKIIKNDCKKSIPIGRTYAEHAKVVIGKGVGQ